jgi:predicted sulfurtransferase
MVGNPSHTNKSKFKLHGNNKISSFELKSWKDYNSVNTNAGVEELNTSINNDRLVWVVNIDFADGYDTRVGHFKNATVTYVIDPETEKVLAKDVHGEQETFTGGPPKFEGKKPIDAD